MSNQWTEGLKQLADSMQATPPEGMLADVKQAMSNRGLTPAFGLPARIVRLRRIRATAASLLILVSIGTAVYLMSSSGRGASSLTPGTTETASRGSVSATSRWSGHVAGHTPPGTTLTDKSGGAFSSEGRQTVRGAGNGIGTVNQQEDDRPMLAEVPADIPKQEDLGENSPSRGRASETSEQEAPSTEKPDAKIRKPSSQPDYGMDMDTDAPLSAQAEPAKRTTAWSISLYAGSMPGLQNGSDDDLANNYMANMPMNDPINTTLFPQAISPSGLYMAEVPHDTSERHHRPLRMGLSVSYPLGRRWYLLSGLTYSRLTSDFTETWNIGERKTEQTLHYLGIPLSLSYDLWSSRKWSLYVSGGGMAELLVKGRSQTAIYEYRKNTTLKEKVADHRPVWSLAGTAGATYRPIPSVGLYIEPGVSWYPRQRHHPKSYYGEHPLNFQFSFGLRFTVGR